MTSLNALLDWYRTLTPNSVRQAANFYHADAHFKDPFNDVRGVASIEKIFTHMFVATENPRFIFIDQIAQGDQAFVTWTFEFGLKGRPYSIVGGSHLKFDFAGKVTEHRDYWDAAEELLQKLPVVGAPVRWLRRAFIVA